MQVKLQPTGMKMKMNLTCEEVKTLYFSTFYSLFVDCLFLCLRLSLCPFVCPRVLLPFSLCASAVFIYLGYVQLMTDLIRMICLI